MKFNRLLPCADQLMWFKYVVKNVARKHGKAATFMPKPMFGDNGSGMHTHQSLWKEGKPLFGGDGYAGLSDTALHYIGGIIKHAKSIAALTNPTTNSYRRLVPGFEAPVNLAYSSRNRSASVRIPITGPNPKTRRIEVRFPDPSCNPYLAFSAMLMAGLDGIQNKINPGDPMDKDIYALSPEELKDVPQMPGSLDEALDTLEKRPRVPAARRRLHQGRDPRVARLQAEQGAQPDPDAPDAVRVLSLLRHLSAYGGALRLIRRRPRRRRFPSTSRTCVALRSRVPCGRSGRRRGRCRTR